MRNREIAKILMADDDEDDRILAHDALVESGLLHELYFVSDGEELMDYLYQRGKYTNHHRAPHPDLILLDLNMPKKDGREALKEIKADWQLRHIPVVILTTSKAQEDIKRCYDLSANSFIIKPVTYTALVEMMSSIAQYWFKTVELPL